MGIKHYKDLSSEEVNKLFSYIEKNETFKVSLKIDGSANIGFGLDKQGRLFVARFVKGQKQNIYNIKHWPKTPQYNSIRAAAKSIFNNKEKICSKLHIDSYVNAEIVYEDTPNVLEYNIGNKIILHDERYNILSDISISSLIDLYKYDNVTGTIKKYVEEVSFDILPCLNLNVKVDSTNNITEDYFYSFTKDNILTKNFPNVHKHEGVVVSVGDLLYKCVDDFAEINKSKWEIRERMEQGFGPAGNFEQGVKTKFLERISLLYDMPMLKSPASKFLLNKNYNQILFYNKVKSLIKNKAKTKIDFNISDKIINICEKSISELDDLIYDYKTKHKADAINYRKTMECYVTNKKYYNDIIRQIRRFSFLSAEKISTIFITMIISKNNKIRSIIGG